MPALYKPWRIWPLLLLAAVLAERARSQRFDFTVWSVKDGLAQSQVGAVVQDCRGYLWAGTHGGGLSRFDGLGFRNFTTFDGLAQDTVRALLVDRECRLWIGTGGGLSRYDGRRFQTYRCADGLPGETVHALAEDRRGRIWIGVEGGLAVYDGHGFQTIPMADAAGLTVEAILEDPAGRLWFGTDAGLHSLDGERPTASTVLSEAPRIGTHALASDARGHLWVGTERGILRYDGKTFTAPEMPGGAADVKAVLVDSSDRLWLGTEGQGVWRYDGRRWTRFSESEGLPSPTVWALAEDREGLIWLGTYRGGLVRFAGERFVYFTAEDGLGDDVVRVILNDRRGRLVFGTFRAGVSFYDGSSFTRLTRSDGLVDDFVLTALEDRRGDLWFGTYDGLSRYDGRRFETFPGELLADSVVRALLEDRRGILWIGTNRGGVTLYDGRRFEHRSAADGLPGNAVMDLAEDDAGGIWIATTAGVARYDPATGFEDLSQRHAFLGGEVYSVLVDDRGELWFAVFGTGVLHYASAAPADERFETWTHADGLRNQGVVSLTQGPDGDLWIGTENGVHRLDLGAYRKRRVKRLAYYGSEDGFRGIECVHNAVATDRDGRLWFGTTHGATRYDPRADDDDPVAALVHITGVRLFLETTDLTPYARATPSSSGLPESLELPHHQNHVTFDFIGIALRSPTAVSYRVRLQGFDRDWLSTDGNRHATYSNLAPGDYLFEVEARSADGAASATPASLRVRIVEPYWQKTWFRSVAALTILAGFYLAHRRRLLSHRRLARELEEQVAARTRLVERQKDELARKNVELESFTYAVSHDLRSPLFTFKGFLKMLERDLAAGRARRIENDLEHLNGAADAMGRQLSALLKLSRAGRVIARRETVAFADLAAEVIAVLDGALRERGIEVEIASSDSLVCDRSRLLQVLQNLVENAIKFMGDQPRPVIRIGSRRDGPETVFFVEDNGQGIDAADQEKVFDLFHRVEGEVEGSGVGLALVKKIIENHGGRLWIESPGRGHGARLLFTVPDALEAEP